MSTLLRTHRLDGNFSRVFRVLSGTGSTVNGTATDLKDSNDSTGDKITASGNGLVQGSCDKRVDATLDTISGPVIQSIDFVRIIMRTKATAAFTWDPTAAVTVEARYNATPIGSTIYFNKDGNGDPETFSGDILVNPITLLPWIYSDITTQSWGFFYYTDTIDEITTTNLWVLDFKVEVWGVAAPTVKITGTTTYDYDMIGGAKHGEDIRNVNTLYPDYYEKRTRRRGPW